MSDKDQFLKERDMLFDRLEWLDSILNGDLINLDEYPDYFKTALELSHNCLANYLMVTDIILRAEAKHE